jgi:hypothetical protein
MDVKLGLSLNWRTLGLSVCGKHIENIGTQGGRNMKREEIT